MRMLAAGLRLNLGWTKVEAGRCYSDQRAGGEGGEKWSDSGYILKVDPMDS